MSKTTKKPTHVVVIEKIIETITSMNEIISKDKRVISSVTRSLSCSYTVEKSRLVLLIEILYLSEISNQENALMKKLLSAGAINRREIGFEEDLEDLIQNLFE